MTHRTPREARRAMAVRLQWRETAGLFPGKVRIQALPGDNKEGPVLSLHKESSLGMEFRIAGCNSGMADSSLRKKINHSMLEA